MRTGKKGFSAFWGEKSLREKMTGLFGDPVG